MIQQKFKLEESDNKKPIYEIISSISTELLFHDILKNAIIIKVSSMIILPKYDFFQWISPQRAPNSKHRILHKIVVNDENEVRASNTEISINMQRIKYQRYAIDTISAMISAVENFCNPTLITIGTQQNTLI